MTIFYTGLILVAAKVLSSCSTDKVQVNMTAEIQRIRDADRALLKAETDRNLEEALDHFATDAVLQPPDVPPVVGTASIRAFYREWFETPYCAIVPESDTVIVSSAGDLAYLVGNSRIELETPDCVIRVPGKYLTIWRKVDDKWLCVAASWSGNQMEN